VPGVVALVGAVVGGTGPAAMLAAGLAFLLVPVSLKAKSGSLSTQAMGRELFLAAQSRQIFDTQIFITSTANFAENTGQSGCSTKGEFDA
jgi:hypothetical protein